MGIETIKEPDLRKNWQNFIIKAHIEIRKAGLDGIDFSEFKNDGLYAKAKTGVPSTKWVFAQNSSNTWVELELKPRTSNGKKYPQVEFYKYIRSSYMMNSQKIDHITWDEEDSNVVDRKAGGQDIRIKVYLDINTKPLEKNNIWINTMIKFMEIFNPIIQSKK